MKCLNILIHYIFICYKASCIYYIINMLSPSKKITKVIHMAILYNTGIETFFDYYLIIWPDSGTVDLY